MKIVAAFLLTVSCAAMQATTVNCTNPDLEVSCSTEGCFASAAGEFTPMSLAFNDTGSVSACAYTGCWEGEGTVQGDTRYLSIIARNLVFSPNVDELPDLQDVVILWDRQDNIALLKLASFAQPMLCEIIPEQSLRD